MHIYQGAQYIMFRLFANVFFTMVIGMTFAFLTSYSLKHSYQKLAAQFTATDNFDIIMMLIAPILSYLTAESLTISGLLALMICAFLQSIYAKNNLERERSQLILRTLKAVSYSCRSICELLMGLGLALHWP